MSLEYFVFIWIGVIAFLSIKLKMTSFKTVNGKEVQRVNFVAAVIAFLPIFLMASTGQAQNDVVRYVIDYRAIIPTWENLQSALGKAESGHGFIVFEYIIKFFVGNNVDTFRFIIAAVHSIPVLYVFRKYSENYWLSLYLFAANGVHLAWMMNGMRQFLAVSIIMAATPWLLQKKYFRLVLVILFAAWFHTSALIMLPVVFVVQGKAWNKKTLLFIVMAIAGMYIFGTYTNILESVLGNTEYSGMVKTYIDEGDDGVNPIRTLVSAVPVVLSLIGKKAIDEDDDNFMNICVNMSIVTLGINLVATVTSGIMIGRLPIYTSLFNYILLPYLIRKVFEDRLSKLVYAIMIGLYFVYYLVETGVLL